MSFKTLFIPCPVCSIKPIPEGYQKPLEGLYYVTLDNGDIVLYECDCHKTWVNFNRKLIKADKANIWTHTEALEYDPVKSHKGKHDISEVKKLVSYVDYFGKEDIRAATVYIQGVARTQKTTIAQWIGLELFRRGFIAYYNNMHGFINGLVPMGFDQIEKYKKFHDDLMLVDCLIIDDAFDKAKTSIQPFQMPYIESFFRERIEMAHKGIVFVSSTPIKKIKENGFSESMQSFIDKSISRHNTLIVLKDVVDFVDTTSLFDWGNHGA